MAHFLTHFFFLDDRVFSRMFFSFWHLTHFDTDRTGTERNRKRTEEKQPAIRVYLEQSVLIIRIPSHILLFYIYRHLLKVQLYIIITYSAELKTKPKIMIPRDQQLKNATTSASYRIEYRI